MEPDSSTKPAAELEILNQARRASGGDVRAWGELMSRFRDRLLRMVSLRLDRRILGRVGASDVIQEASLEALRRLDDYLMNPTMPFFLWLRFLAAQQVALAHRTHLKTKARDAGREVQVDYEGLPETSTAALAAQLLGRLTSPSRAAIRAERRARVQLALGAMEAADREILALRHYEQLSNGEIALVLGLEKSAASKRYLRALTKLKGILSDQPDTDGEFES